MSHTVSRTFFLQASITKQKIRNCTFGQEEIQFLNKFAKKLVIPLKSQSNFD